MSTFSGSSVITPRGDLGLAFEEFSQEANQAGYIGLRIAPVAEAELAFGQFEYSKADEETRARSDERNADGSYNRIDGNFDWMPYRTKEYGLEERVDHNRAAVFSRAVSSEVRAARRVRWGLMENHEKRVIDQVNAKTPHKTYSSNEFDTPTYDLVGEFTDLILAFRLKCGAKPTTLVVDDDIINRMLQNQSVQDKFVGSANRTAAEIGLAGLATALGIDEVIRANAVKNTAVAPKAKTFDTMFPRTKALLCVVNNTPDTVPAQWLRTIHWAEDGSRIGGAFEQYEDASKRGTVLRSRSQYQVKEVYADCAMVLAGIITPA